MKKAIKMCEAAESTHFGMGTTMTHKVFGVCASEAIGAAEKEAQRLENMLSRFQPASDIARVNGSAGIRLEKICYPGLWTFQGNVMAVSISLSGRLRTCGTTKMQYRPRLKRKSIKCFPWWIIYA